MNQYFSALFEKIFEVPWYLWIVLAALVGMGISLIVSGRKSKWSSKQLASAAMCMAIAFVLSCIRLFRMPQGGSVTLCSMLPIVAFSVAFGPLKGLVVSVGYGVLQFIQNPSVVGWQQLLLDYPMAFGVLALGGLVHKLSMPQNLKLPAAVLIGSLMRLVTAVVSGAIFFGEYAPEGQSALVYSIIYNGSYLSVDALICVLVAFIPSMQRIVPLMRGEQR